MDVCRENKAAEVSFSTKWKHKSTSFPLEKTSLIQQFVFPYVAFPRSLRQTYGVTWLWQCRFVPQNLFDRLQISSWHSELSHLSSEYLHTVLQRVRFVTLGLNSSLVCLIC